MRPDRLKISIFAAALVLCSTTTHIAASGKVLHRLVQAGPPATGAPSQAQSTSKPSNSPASSQAPNPVPATGTPATVMDDKKVSTILGKNVRSKDGEDMGRIVDVLVSETGQLRAAVIDFGGFLGVGSRKIAVDWGALHFAPGGKPDLISLDMTKDQVRVVPEYKEGAPIVILSAPAPAPADAGTARPASEK